VGVFASVIGAVQFAILERGELARIPPRPDIILYFVGFAVCMFCIYSCVPVLFARGVSE